MVLLLFPWLYTVSKYSGWQLAVIDLKSKKSTLLCLSSNRNAWRTGITTTIELAKVSFCCARFSYCFALFSKGRKTAQWSTVNHWNTMSDYFPLLSFYCSPGVHSCSIALCLIQESDLLVTNKDKFLNMQLFNNKVSSHKEMLCTFCFYSGAHTTAVISLLTVNGVAIDIDQSVATHKVLTVDTIQPGTS